VVSFAKFDVPIDIAVLGVIAGIALLLKAPRAMFNPRDVQIVCEVAPDNAPR
jgi:hypothetical protein